jgi:hypothetical protein
VLREETNARQIAGGWIYDSKEDGKVKRMWLSGNRYTFQSSNELIPRAIWKGEDSALLKKAKEQVVA